MESCCSIDKPAPQPVTDAPSYKPLVIMVLVVLAGAVAAAYGIGLPFWPNFMTLFMGFFLLVFSMFKLFDVAGFARDFTVYDLVAQRIPAYATVYPFIEFLLGIGYLTQWDERATNLLTILVMGIGLIGVLRFYRTGRVTRCACMGSVLNVPVGTVTILENATMVVMAALSLYLMI